MTKYCTESDYGYNGFTDGLLELLPEDDAATANWGSGWRMPSNEQYDELINSNYTTTEWTTQNGVNGRLITSKSNGHSIFLPAAGFRYDTTLDYTGSTGRYLSRSLVEDYPVFERQLYFTSDDVSTGNFYRYHGFSVRPVRTKN